MVQYQGLLEIPNAKYIIAASTMFLIVAIVLYVMFIIYKLLKKRESVIDVELPDLEQELNKKKEITPFKGLEEIEVELVDPIDEDLLISKSTERNQKDIISEAILIETGEIIIPEDDSGSYMPPVVDEDLQAAAKEADRLKKEKEQDAIRRIKELALEDVKEDDFEVLLTDKEK